MNYFNEAAKNWDTPEKVERAKLVAKQIQTHLLKGKRDHACEFGCGTGLLSWFLKDEFEKISLIDESEGMLDVLLERIEEHQLHHFHPFLIDLEKESEKIKDESFDVIYTLLSLHHVEDMGNVIKTFHQKLKSGGQLVIVDLEKEDGSFHAHVDNYNKHHGIDSEWLKTIAEKKGLSLEEQKVSFVIEKEAEGQVKKYPVFLQLYTK